MPALGWRGPAGLLKLLESTSCDSCVSRPKQMATDLHRSIIKNIDSGHNSIITVVDTFLCSVEFTSFFLTLVRFADDFSSLSPNPGTGIDAAVALAADS